MTRSFAAILITLSALSQIACQPEIVLPAATLTPLPGMEEEAPVINESTHILFTTSAGEFIVEVYPQAAPNAAQRFIALVESGFYDDTPISRVVPGFVAQFGINWREPHNAWEENTFDDDPSLFALERGTLAFAKAGPDTNSTQVFINYDENNRLASPQLNFSAFAQVIEGMEIVDNFVSVGDPNGGLNQQRLWEDGDVYLQSLSELPTMIVSASIVE